jgi:hypothetical protein
MRFNYDYPTAVFRITQFSMERGQLPWSTPGGCVLHAPGTRRHPRLADLHADILGANEEEGLTALQHAHTSRCLHQLVLAKGIRYRK